MPKNPKQRVAERLAEDGTVQQVGFNSAASTDVAGSIQPAASEEPPSGSANGRAPAPQANQTKPPSESQQIANDKKANADAAGATIAKGARDVAVAKAVAAEAAAKDHKASNDEEISDDMQQ